MSGPARTPTAQARLRGFPHHRKANPQEPTPEPMATEPPDDLTGEARVLWTNVVPELVRIGCLTAVDRDEFAVGCRLRAYGLEGLRAGEKLSERQMQALLHSSRIFARFGIGASDRTRISVAPPKAPGKWASLAS